jgi:hypothetical protein
LGKTELPVSNPILSPEELLALWNSSQAELASVAPEDRYRALIALADRTFPPERDPLEIANRFYALMVCLDASQDELDKPGIGVFGKKNAAVRKDAILTLWDYFGDRSRPVDPQNVVRASEIL